MSNYQRIRNLIIWCKSLEYISEKMYLTYGIFKKVELNDKL